MTENLPQILWFILLFSSEKLSFTLFHPGGSINILVAHPPLVLYQAVNSVWNSDHRKAERIPGLNTCFRVSMKENRGSNFETLSAFSALPTHFFIKWRRDRIGIVHCGDGLSNNQGTSECSCCSWDYMFMWWEQGFLGGSVVKNWPAMQETQEMQFRSLGPENPLEKEKATHSSILFRKIPWTEEPGGV